MQAEAMGRLDPVLGRSSLDAPKPSADGPTQTELWLDTDPEAWSAPTTDGHKGSDKGSPGPGGQPKGPT